MNWYRNLSIRWKLQFGFFAVTMITTIYSRLLASHELQKMIAIAQQGNASPDIVSHLRLNLHDYILNSFWESGLEFVGQFFLIAFVANLFAKPIIHLGHSLTQVEKGDLTKRISNNSHDEVGVLEKAFNSVLDKLNNILREVEDGGKHMEQSAFQVTKISHEIYEVGKEQEALSSGVITDMQQLYQVSSDVQTQAIEAAERSHQVESLAQEGIELVRSNINAMKETTQEVTRASQEIEELEQAAQQIHVIVNTIKEISGQTNLLALNAAIEAARAGEQGRGFAVVADEVRKLAERTSNSAEEVSSIIEQLSGKVQQVTSTMSVVVEKVHLTQQGAGQTAETIEVMAGHSIEAAKGNQGISDISRQQLEQFGLLQSNIWMLFVTLKENGTKVEATAAIGEDLRLVSGRLNELMAGFTFSHATHIPIAQHEQRGVPRADNSLLVKIVQGEDFLDALVQDFSLTGVRLSLARKLDTAKPIDMKIYLPHENLSEYENQTPLQLSGEIAWQEEQEGRDRCTAGVQFIGMDDSNREKIRQCFDFYKLNAEFV